MDEDHAARLAALEHDNRRLLAIAGAQEFAIEILLTQFMRQLSHEDRLGFVQAVIRVGSKTDGLHAASDAEAEALADVAVQMQERLSRLMEKALARASAA